MSAAPTPSIVWPIVITLNVNDQFIATAGADVFTLTVPAGAYATPQALLDELNTLASATNGVGSGPLNGQPLNQLFSHQFQFILAQDGSRRTTIIIGSFPSADDSITINWTANAHTRALGQLLGFTTGSNLSSTGASGAIGLTSPNQIMNFWTPGLPVRSDTRDTSTFARGLVATPGASAGLSAVYALDLAQQFRREIQFENVPDNRIFIANEGSVLNTAIERLWQPNTGGFTSFRYYPDRDADAYAVYSLDEETAQLFAPERQYDTVPLYKFALKMLRVGP